MWYQPGRFGARVMSAKPCLLLVHGAWHGSWSWDKLQAKLTTAGWAVHTIDLPSVAAKGEPRYGLHDDAQVVRDRLTSIEGPVVVVAHSYGGAAVSEGASGVSGVQHIIYLAAFQLDVGESLLGFAGGKPPPWQIIDGDLVTPVTPHATFYGDVDSHEADRAVDQLLPTSMSAFTETLNSAAWKTIPSSYIVCEQDHAIPVFLQEQMALRASTTYRLSSSHSPFLSRTSDLVALIEKIAEG